MIIRECMLLFFFVEHAESELKNTIEISRIALDIRIVPFLLRLNPILGRVDPQNIYLKRSNDF